MDDLQEFSKVWLARQVLTRLVDTTSKQQPGDHAPLRSLVVSAVEQVLSSSAPSALFTTHPHLLSLLARLCMTLDPTLRHPRYDYIVSMCVYLCVCNYQDLQDSGGGVADWEWQDMH